MKKSRFFVASIAAASTIAISISSPSLNFSINFENQDSHEEAVSSKGKDNSLSHKDKFAPRMAISSRHFIGKEALCWLDIDEDTRLDRLSLVK
ncbi:hypothetical protein HHK36_004569 [Tetracentron sinense]|uniref:Uncharacterized protein n=1 Tax=Tetracentron sinense TaxID=13715 RepID=A0A834ZR45_TETSI|nr:hypothetical protein HHK36_004569 [Tetracentron sinense]